MAKREHVIGTAGLVVGLIATTCGALALYLDLRRDKHNGVGEPVRPDPPPPPPAQTTPVPPPTVATIKNVQRWINIIAGKDILGVDGSAGPATTKAIQAFQTRHGMTATGKLDGMTQSTIQHEADRVVDEKTSPLFAFRLAWDSHGVWTVQDSMKFAYEMRGFTDRAHPPSEREVAARLVHHYGPTSSVGQAILAHRYAWTCPDCLS